MNILFPIKMCHQMATDQILLNPTGILTRRQTNRMSSSADVPVRVLIINPNTSRHMTDALKPMVESLGFSNVSPPPTHSI